MSDFWLCVVGIVALTLGAGISVGMYCGPWWGVLAGAVSFIVTFCASVAWIVSNARITG